MSQDPHDQLLLQIRGAVAEYERPDYRPDAAGRLAKYQAGTLAALTRPLYGYRLDPDRVIQPGSDEESEAAVVREIFALYAQGNYSPQSLATYLQKQGIPTPSGQKTLEHRDVARHFTSACLSGQVYARRYRYRAAQVRRSATHPLGQPHQTPIELPPDEWTMVATIPPLVNQEQFDRVQARLAQKSEFCQTQ
ncbi:MAG: recombinase family protein [Anaerolineae bacterium]